MFSIARALAMPGLELRDFGGGQFAPASAGGCGGGEAVKEQLDFRQREAGVFGEADEREPVDGFRGVDAAAVLARRGREQAGFLVEANRGGLQVA